MADPYTELETAIVDKLQADASLTNQVKVMAWPDDGETGRVSGAGEVKVRFIDSQSTPPNAPSNRFLQQEQAVFELRLGLKALRSHAGAYPILATIRDLISGLAPTLTGAEWAVQLPGFFHVESGFVGRSDTHKVWVFASLYAVDLVYMHRR